jgi:hypothetical protein
MKKRYKKFDVNIQKEINKEFSNKNNGLSIMVAGRVLFDQIAGIGFIFFLKVLQALFRN